MSLVVEEARGAGELASLAQEWTGLWKRCPDVTPFQSPEWLLACLRAFAPENVLALVVREGGALAGLVPLYVQVERNVRVVRPVGVAVSDVLDPLLLPSCAEEAARAAWTRLMRSKAAWDRCDFGALLPGSPFVRAAPPARVTWEDTPCVARNLPNTTEELLATISRALCANVLAAERRAARERLVIDVAPAAELVATLDVLWRLHEARWAERGQPGISADPRVRALHDECVPLLHARGLTRLYTLKRQGETIAVLYLLTYGRTIAPYVGGFDIAHKKLSPGILLFARALRDAIADGRREIDFLRGREPYKYAWGAEDRPRAGLTVHAQAT